MAKNAETPSRAMPAVSGRLMRRISHLHESQERIETLIGRIDRSVAERLARLEHQMVKLREAQRPGRSNLSTASFRRPTFAAPTGPLPVVQPLGAPMASGEDLAVLRQCQLFCDLSAEILSPLLALAQTRTLEDGEALYVAGDIADSIHIVVEGAFILKDHDGSPAGSKRLGEILGETAVFTGNPHPCSAEATGRAVVHSLPWSRILGLFREIPELAIRFCAHFAQQMEVGEASKASRLASQKLEGSLDRFDLAQVLGSLLEFDTRTGILTILDRERAEVGTIIIVNGQPERARCKALLGEEAFHELMLMEQDGGYFEFRDTDIHEVESHLDAKDDFIRRPKVSLLLDASRLRDEVAELRRETFPDLDEVWIRSSDRVPWRDKATRDAALRIWRLLGRGATLGRILEVVPRGAHVVLSILSRLARHGHIVRPGGAPPVIPDRRPTRDELEFVRPMIPVGRTGEVAVTEQEPEAVGTTETETTQAERPTVAFPIPSIEPPRTGEFAAVEARTADATPAPQPASGTDAALPASEPPAAPSEPEAEPAAAALPGDLDSAKSGF